MAQGRTHVPRLRRVARRVELRKGSVLDWGTHAVALHARPRATKDLDLYIGPGRRNATRVVSVIARFFGGKAPSYVSVKNLIDPRIMVQFGVAPVRVDLLPRLVTVPFAKAWKRRVRAKFGKIPANFLSLGGPDGRETPLRSCSGHRQISSSSSAPHASAGQHAARGAPSAVRGRPSAELGGFVPDQVKTNTAFACIARRQPSRSATHPNDSRP
jgi:hypothetical protein